jgi:hypothetical protein
MAPTLTLPDLPPDLIRAVAQEGARDAVRVAHFLDALAQTPAGQSLGQRPVRLPADFLLGLGAALRLLLWERNGIRVHLDAGLPPARDALRDVFRSVIDPEVAARTATLPSRVSALFVDRFAWTGRLELEADVTLGEAQEEALLDALAEFLWVHRPGQRTLEDRHQ